MFRRTNRSFRLRISARRVLVEMLEPRIMLSADSTVQLNLLSKEVQLSAVTGTPQGLSPAMIEQAYDLKNIIFTDNNTTVDANGAGETIAIVDAFGDPDIVSDLETFDANFGISNDDSTGQFALTVDTPEGAVATDAGWALEESLDVEWAHAIAPGAHIDLVEANAATISALTSATAFAADQSGVVAVSMSWGDSPEFAGETAYDSNFVTPSGHEGVTFVAASGDDGEPNYPSTSAKVLAVGGTTLDVDDNGDWLGESPWVDSGGGHSPYEDTNKPDVAYDGDPDTGFLVYDSIRYEGGEGWQTIGGTSAGTPQWSAIIAIVDQGRAVQGESSLDGPSQTIPDIYALSSSDFNTITGSGFTGLGSPIGEKVISDLVGGGITSVGSGGSGGTGGTGGTGGSGGSSPDVATQLAFNEEPSNTAAGSDIAPAVTVDVEDADGNVVTSDDSTVTLSLASGPGTLNGTLTVTVVNGVATFSDLSLDTAGTYRLAAVDGSLSGATSATFAVNPGAVSDLVITEAPTAMWVYGTVGTIEATAEDAFGNTVSNAAITLSVTDVTNSTTPVGPFSSQTNDVGVATFGGFALDEAGTYDLQAADGSVSSAISTLVVIAPVTEHYLLNGIPLGNSSIINEERRVAAQTPPTPSQVEAADPTQSAPADGSEEATVLSADDVGSAPVVGAVTPFSTEEIPQSWLQTPNDLLN